MIFVNRKPRKESVNLSQEDVDTFEECLDYKESEVEIGPDLSIIEDGDPIPESLQAELRGRGLDEQ